VPPSYRPNRVGDQIRQELSDLLARGAVHDPGIGFITLTRVSVTSDLQIARVYYTMLGDAAAQRETDKALKRALPFFRRLVGQRLQLRRVPEIEFRLDHSVAHQDRIEQILRDLHTEEANRSTPSLPPMEPEPTMTATRADATVSEVASEIRRHQRFVLASHVRPDGDAIGSQLAMAFALRALGKEVRVVNRDPAPDTLLDFPGVSTIEIAPSVTDAPDAVIVMECGDLARTGVTGLDRACVINIDHHLGNTGYGHLNWVDLSAAACGEMVFDLIRELGVPLTAEMAVHVYVAILTDTGSFHYSGISPRTFDICRQCMEAGVDPPAVARRIFDRNHVGRLKIYGAVLNQMRLDATGRIATLTVDHALAEVCGGTYEDTDGLNNLPLSVEAIRAVVFFKENGPGEWRVSMRSKDNVDVRAVAATFGGGGHKNAAGCSATGVLADLQTIFEDKVTEALHLAEAEAAPTAPGR
jgi:bifunctional oligoribonuclease and PAP phosphatase NrnA